ncbi:MAG: YjgP/YjgQ family permease [Flavobacterium sp.]|nr:MAG: YjgP/YjgQ family permease [Flavobacterium sp.]
MKLLDRYILTSFLTTFASVFIILFFIFILQGIWLFIAELAGKDLDIWLVAKFLLFYSPKMIPLVLPLSILLASIMTFGSFAENYEFAAMKSSGISLSRAMRGLTVFIFGLSIVAFFFANNVIPKAEYKFINLRKNILQRKPAMAIAEGQFNAIGNFNIKVDKKSGENGEKLSGVTIHQRAMGAANATIIRSKRGLLKSSEESNLLQLELFDGYYYEEINSKKPDERQRQPFAKSSFSKQIMNIDLTALNSNDVDDEQVANTNTMLNVRELNYTLDSLQTNYKKDADNIATNLAQRTNNLLFPESSTRGNIAVNPLNDSIVKAEADTIAKKETPKNLLTIFNAPDKQKVLEIAVNSLTGTEMPIKSGKAELYEKVKGINNHWLALYDKFVIAYACLMMFFIGAPLGAIIRKGGLGLPIVFAVLIFIIFHFINTFGKKVAQENGIPPFLGAWMSSFVLTPLAILLTYRATNDIGMINMDVIMMPLQKAVQKIFKIKAKA